MSVTPKDEDEIYYPESSEELIELMKEDHSQRMQELEARIRALEEENARLRQRPHTSVSG